MNEPGSWPVNEGPHSTFTSFGGENSGFAAMTTCGSASTALDLGGLHPALQGDVDAKASALGIVKGGTSAFDVFHAERHTTASNFSVETTIGCFPSEMNEDFTRRRACKSATGLAAAST